MTTHATPSNERVWVDGTCEQLHDESEIELAIYSVLAWAFDHRRHRPEYRRDIRDRLPLEPTIAEVVEAVFESERRRRGLIPAERARREDASNVMAAFLLLDPLDRRQSAAAFRAGRAGAGESLVH